MLAAGVSHEVNTPLASILACLDGIKRTCEGLARGQQPSLEQVSEYARVASTQVERCGTITQQFMRLARGKTLTRDAVDLQQAIDIVVRLSKVLSADAGVTVSVATASDPAGVIANEAAVQQVLLNLVVNAIQASARGQAVDIAVRRGRQIEVSVRDRGRGIAPADLGRLFEPFFSRRENGTGLGLFVSLGLARGWGGDILVESAQGEGTTFTVLFPLPQDAKEEHDGAP